MTRKIIDDYSEDELFNKPSLSKYHRMPGLTVKLPTDGAFLPPGSYHPTITGEVEVYPMRAADELLMKSPDALMSGYGIERLLNSCVPSIQAPREVSTADLDVLLLAIRASTSGDTMAISVACPECGEVNEFDCNLPVMVSTIKQIPKDNPVRLTDLIVAYLRPYNLKNATTVAMVTFEETRKMQALQDASDDARRAAMNEGYTRLSNLNIATVADCVIKVVVPEGEVTDRAEIDSFVRDLPSPQFAKLENKLKELNELGMDKDVEVCCSKCKHVWKTQVEFNPASFFDNGS